MKAYKVLALLSAAILANSCAFLLDFDELQDDPGGDASIGGTAGAAGGAGSSGTGGSGDAGVSLDQVAQTTAAALCMKLDQCFGTPAMPLIFGDADCTQSLANGLRNSTFALVAESVKAGKMTVESAQIDPCLAAFQALDCKAVSFDFPEACRQALKGTAASGQPCAHALECTPGLYCEVQSACPGKCAPFRKDGETCSETDPCLAGLGCALGKCAPPAAAGEPCLGSTGKDCEVGAFCFGNTAGATPKEGACIPTTNLFSAPIGQPCSSWLEALTSPATFKLCNAGVCPVFKGAAQRKCSSFLSTEGSPCDISVPDPCPSGQYCNGATCTNLPGNGAPCAPVTTIKGRCLAGHICDGTDCIIQRDNGKTCSANEECFGGQCDLGNAECIPPGCPVTQ